MSKDAPLAKPAIICNNEQEVELRRNLSFRLSPTVLLPGALLHAEPTFP
jgi:hypothetical protein